jgi:hypothetical protein
MGVSADDKPDDKYIASMKQKKKSIRWVHQVQPQNFVRGF